MSRLAKQIFRLEKKVTLEHGGASYTGRGLVMKLKQRQDLYLSESSDKLGLTDSRLYVYCGDCGELIGAEGGRLTCNGSAYTVLKAEWVCAGFRPVYVRAVLEQEAV